MQTARARKTKEKNKRKKSQIMSFNDKKRRNETRFMVEVLPPTANLSSACYQGYTDNK